MALRTLTAALLVVVAIPLSAQQRYAAAGAPATVSNDYIVGPRDVLVITSYDQRDLSGKFTVEGDGTFTFPLLGRIKAGGMTLREVEAVLEANLVERGLFKAPEIAVAVDQYKSQKIFILGEVRKPGVYELSGSMRLIEALALADSTTPTAGGEVVIVPTANDPSGRTEAVRINLHDLESGKAFNNVALRDGDTILVPRAENIYVFGQVKTPGAYPLRADDMTVLQALSLAGGVTERGSMGRIEIVRVVNGEKKEVRAEPGDMVEAGDTIVVPERFF